MVHLTFFEIQNVNTKTFCVCNVIEHEMTKLTLKQCQVLTNT